MENDFGLGESVLFWIDVWKCDEMGENFVFCRHASQGFFFGGNGLLSRKVV